MARTPPPNVGFQIYFVHINPTLCAEQLPDQHVRQLVVDLVPLLANAYYLPKAVIQAPKDHYGKAYTQAHLDTDLGKWAVADFKHWDWLRMHLLGLAKEHNHRFNKDPVSLPALQYMGGPGRSPLAWMRHKHFDEPPMQAPTAYQRRVQGPIASYRNFIVEGQGELHKWTKRNPPAWIVPLKTAQRLTDEIIGRATLKIMNERMIKPKDISLERWKWHIELATRELNGEKVDVSGSDDVELIEDIIEKAIIQLVEVDQYRPEPLSDAEWTVIKYLATQIVNGLDPFNPPKMWDYTTP